MTLEEIAHLVGGAVRGDARITIQGASPLKDASYGEITLVDHSKHLDRLANCMASAVVLGSAAESIKISQLIVNDPHAAFSKILKCFRPYRSSLPPLISPHATIDPSARIGAQVSIGAGSVIGRDCVIGDRCMIHSGVHLMDGCRIGLDCELFPAVVLYPDTILGDRVMVHSGSVLGAYGFGYKQLSGKHHRTAQLGWVEIEDDVELGACATVDRGTYGATRIGEGTKIDNHVMIAHNCRIGRHNLLCSQVGVAGSSSTGDYVVMAGQVGLRDHTHIGDRSVIGAQAGVTSDVAADQAMLGSPAMPQKEQLILYANTPKLPQMRKEIRALQIAVERLEMQSASASTLDSNRHAEKNFTGSQFKLESTSINLPDAPALTSSQRQLDSPAMKSQTASTCTPTECAPSELGNPAQAQISKAKNAA